MVHYTVSSAHNTLYPTTPLISVVRYELYECSINDATNANAFSLINIMMRIMPYECIITKHLTNVLKKKRISKQQNDFK